VRACVHSGECSYVYKYLCLYCVSKKMCALVLIMGKICYGRERIKCFGFSEGGKVELGLRGKPEYGLGGKILSPRENTTGLWFSGDPKKQNFRIRLHPEGRFIVESSESVYN
jgi:hypothetical protein